MKKDRILPILGVLFSVLAWGISYVSIKVVLEEVPPVSIALFRQLVAIVALAGLMRISGERFLITKRDLPPFFLATLFGIVLYSVFENSGLQYTTAANASMLVAAIPIFALIIESIISRTRMPFFTLMMVLVSISGVYLVLFEGGLPDFSSETFFGNMLVFCAMMSWIIFTFLNRRLGRKHSSLKMTTIQTLCSMPLFLPFVIREIPSWQTPGTLTLIHLTFLGVFCSAGAYVSYLYGLQKLGPVIPSAFLNLIPVVTILTGMVLLAEMPTAMQLIGAGLIIGSLMALTIKGRKKAVTEVPIPPTEGL